MTTTLICGHELECSCDHSLERHYLENESKIDPQRVLVWCADCETDQEVVSA